MDLGVAKVLTAEGHLDSRSKLWILAILFGAFLVPLADVYIIGMKSIMRPEPRLFLFTGILIFAGLSTFLVNKFVNISAKPVIDSAFAAVHWLGFVFFGFGSIFLMYLFATGERDVEYLGLAAVSVLVCVALAPFDFHRSISPKIGIVVSGFCFVVFLASGNMLVALMMAGAIALTILLFLAWKRP